jgi:hypothetical protein
MINIRIITNEWIDIIFLYPETDICIRKTNNDKGTYILNDDNIIIEWEGWGKQLFKKINDNYYDINKNTFEFNIESNYWNDICICNPYNNTLYRKYCPREIGVFTFDDNELIIKWSDRGIERFYQFKYGKLYSNTNFANILKSNAKKEIKMIAVVFPQFHEVYENNLFWGKGFTEWTLLRNIPRIVNDEIIKQPHSDIGYYDLTNIEHRKYMRVLADKYNIYGFCYYHYWFKNKKVMYEPTELMLKDGEPNKPFFFCWANESWTKRWDGGNNEILLQQDYTDNNGNIEHFYYLLDFFKNKNYIKKYNKPIFVFYRIEEECINEIKSIIKLWNELALKEGFNGIHFMKFLGPFSNKLIDEMDGYIEFEPGYCTQQNYHDIICEDKNFIFDENNDNFNENIYLDKNEDVKKYVIEKKLKYGYDHYMSLNEKEKKVRTSKFYVYDGDKLYNHIIDLKRIHPEQHRGLITSWNNVPRRNYTNKEYNKYPHYYKNMDSYKFGNLCSKLLNKINNDNNKTDDFLLITAWNEWNEQSILEPNNEDGYNYLKQLSKNYLDFYNNPTKLNILNICHKGGGTEKYMRDLKNLFPEYNFIDFENFEYGINYNILYKNIDIIHINSILYNNLKNNYFFFFEKFFKGVKKYLTIHDYQWLFPDNPNILKDDFIGQKPVNIHFFDHLLSICDKIIFPSNNIYNNYKIYIDLDKYNNNIFIVNHCDKLINYNFLYIPKIYSTINIAFIGNFSKYKGSEIFKNLTNSHLYYKNYKIMYYIFGYIENPDNENFNSDNTKLLNTYCDTNIVDAMHGYNIHGITHLSLFEETYCYALTNSINSGIPILYINRGSFNERLKESEKYFPTEINNINDTIIHFFNYIIKKQETYNFYKLDQHIQPNTWYINNY